MQAAFLALPIALQALIFVALTLAAAEVSARLTRRAARGLRLESDLPVTIAVYTVVGTAYGILLSFAVSLVWGENSGVAAAVSNEAQALSQLHRSAGLVLAQPFAGQAQQLTRHYAKTVVEAEWPTLRRHERGNEARSEAETISDFLNQVPLTAASNPTSYAQFQAQAAKWLDARQVRKTTDSSDMPLTMWAVLLTGAMVLFVFHGFLVMQSRRASFLVLVPLATIIGIELFLIFTLDRPFAGAFAVDPGPFVEFLRATAP